TLQRGEIDVRVLLVDRSDELVETELKASLLHDPHPHGLRSSREIDVLGAQAGLAYDKFGIGRVAVDPREQVDELTERRIPRHGKTPRTSRERIQPIAEKQVVKFNLYFPCTFRNFMHSGGGRASTEPSTSAPRGQASTGSSMTSTSG